jgi:tRNA pseudouridine55 synthase
MARKKKGDPVHGWVVVDKPSGVGSTKVVAVVRHVFNAQKAGHAGTLDPMASGILAVALGEATKTVPYVMDDEKVYRFTARWGEARNTDDADGTVTATSDVRPARKAIEAAIPRFVGEILQTPPAFSAVKVEGERAYDIARDGEAPVLAPRPVVVEEARLIAMVDADTAEFEMRCGKGTYVRAWVRDLALALGTCGHVSRLRRTKSGPFSEKDAIGLETLEGFMHSPAAFEHLRPIATALDGIPALAVSGQDTLRLRCGNPVMVRANQFATLTAAAEGDDLQGLTVFCTGSDGTPIALAEFEAGTLRPFRVFNF